MYIKKSKIERKTPIGELPKGKISIHLNGADTENIWVAKDEENKVMYLLNHALMFYPYPSWGIELPLGNNVDMLPYRGNNIEETNLTVCNETYEVLKQWINSEDKFDCEAYIQFINSIPDGEEEEV